MKRFIDNHIFGSLSRDFTSHIEDSTELEVININTAFKFMNLPFSFDYIWSILNLINIIILFPWKLREFYLRPSEVLTICV